MDIEVHKRALSILHIVLGVLTVVGLFFAFFFLSTFSGFIIEEIAREEGRDAAMIFEFISWGAVFLFGLIILTVALPSVIGGIALLNGQNWGLILLMISGCISLINFPLGTAKGVYTIWVYVQDNKQRKELNDKN